MTPPGIDPETVRLVAQCLNYYAAPGPGNVRTDEIKHEKKWRKTKSIDTLKQSMARSNGPNSVK